VETEVVAISVNTSAEIFTVAPFFVTTVIPLAALIVVRRRYWVAARRSYACNIYTLRNLPEVFTLISSGAVTMML
jgi:hypothetical protein